MSISDLVKMKREYTEKVKQVGREGLVEEFARFFGENPAVTGIFWTQYTPHFNDGDACVFRVREFQYRIGGESLTSRTAAQVERNPGYEEAEEGLPFAWYDGTYGIEDAGLKEKCRAFENDMDQVSDLFEAVFGDGVRVVAYPGGFDVDEYSHD